MSYTPSPGDAVDLVFAGAYTAPAGNVVVLDFNPGVANQFDVAIAATLDDVALVISLVPTALAALSATLDDAVVALHANFGVKTAIAATLDDCGAFVVSDWSAGVWRGLSLVNQASHTELAVSERVHRQTVQGHQQALPTRAANQSVWQKGSELANAVAPAWSQIPRKHSDRTTGWAFVPAKTAQRNTGYDSPQGKLLDRASLWQLGTPHSIGRLFACDAVPRKALASFLKYLEGSPRRLDYLAGYGLGTRTDRRWNVLPWEVANPHSWIWDGWRIPPLPPVPPYIPSAELVFYQPQLDYPGGAILEFGYPCWAWPLHYNPSYITQGYIIVLHSINVTRLPDLINIPVLSASMQFDIDSWAWGVSINLQSLETMALLEPVGGEPRQVRIEIDGLFITALIEAWSERRQFGETLYTATGRSVLALMAQPYAPIRSYLEPSEQTAAQLIDRELLNTGWSAAYHSDLVQLFTTDWLVPGGAWSYQNKSPVDAIVQIARAAGARAYADRNAALVHIAPRYPVSPWNWALALPDKTIPLSLARSVSTQLAPQPDYNHIYISGQNQGVIVSVTRQGTAGDKPAPMITDSLITYANAGRERARNSLANTGRQSRVTLDLPLNAITGLLEPGQLVEVADTFAWRGLVTSINVSAAHGAVSQQVEIERHYQ